VGLGGTGSQLARILARLIYDMKQRQLQAPHLRLIDPDRVDILNCGRQLYIPADVGHYKVEVLGRRFNQALGLDTEWITEAVDAERHFASHGNCVIGAVDNHVARGVLAQIPGIWLDTGNHYDSGQICIGTSSDRKAVLSALHSKQVCIHTLPNAALIFPSLLEPEVVQETVPAEPISCGARVAHGAQHLFINDLVATIAAGYLHKLLYRKPIDTFLSYVNLDTLTVRSLPITCAELLPYLHDE
jgi:PRTRC genetic system ThiF family protein